MRPICRLSGTFADQDDIAARDHNDQQLHAGHQIHDAMTGAELPVRFAEPIGENPVFRDAHQHTGRAYDGGVDCSAEDQEADDNNKGAEGQS